MQDFSKKPKAGPLFVTISILIPIVIVLSGFWFYRLQQKQLYGAAVAQISLVAESKIKQIISWRAELIRDAQNLSGSFTFKEAFDIWLRTKDPTAQMIVARDLELLTKLYDFSNVLVASDSGEILMSYPDGAKNLSGPVRAAAETAKAEQRVVLTDLYEGDAGPRLSVVAPMLWEENKHLGLVVVHIDPRQFLYDLLQKWPLPSETAETLLVRREGNDLLYLNEIRHRQDTALKFRVPLDRDNVPAVQAVKGRIGVFEGRDYRGVPVFSYVGPVPGSAWFMVSKVDADEAFAVLKFRSVVIILFTGAALATAVLSLLVISHRSTLRYYKAAHAAEESLYESREYMAATLRSIGDAVITTDRDGKVTLLNEVAERLTGWKTEEARGCPLTTVFKIINAHSRRTVEDPVMRVLREGKVVGLANHTVLVSRGGSEYQIADSAAPIRAGKEAVIGVVLVFRDVTEEYLMQERFAAEAERLAVTLRSIGDAVISTDTDGRVVMMNKVAESLTGWKSEDAAGCLLPEVFHIINQQTRMPCENPVSKVLRTGLIEGLANHTVLIRKDGSEFVIDDSAAPIKDKSSKTIGVVLVFRDATEKLRAEEHMHRAQKLSSLGVLAGGIAHDFNNLLGGVLGYVDIAREYAKEAKLENVVMHLSQALTIFERARGLSQQLLTFSKGGAPARKVANLGLTLRETVVFALSGSSVNCSFNIPDNLWPCNFDPNQIAQVIDNIVINAKDAMPEGGKLEVSARNITIEAGRQAVAPGDYVQFTIKDNGIGIPREFLSKIFDPFFTTKQSGSGLGLATSHSIIKRHDGLIDVESEPGHGSAFTVYLPALRDAKVETTGAGLKLQKLRGRILVMDDESYMRDIASKMLTSAGHVVVLAANGAEAISQFEQARARNELFDVLLLDLTIPGGMGGKETARRIKEIDPGTPIIVASGYSEDPVMSNPAEHGFSGSIKKPYLSAEIREIVARIITSRESGKI